MEEARMTIENEIAKGRKHRERSRVKVTQITLGDGSPIEGLTIENISPVLVIVGRNGIGKTRFLEEGALALDPEIPFGWAGTEEHRGWVRRGRPITTAMKDQTTRKYALDIAQKVDGPGAAHAAAASVGAALAAGHGGLVVIDEVLGAVHPSNVDAVWRTILEIAARDATQLMVATSARETIEAIARTAQRLDENAQMVRLEKRPHGARSIRYDKETFATLQHKWIECR